MDEVKLITELEQKIKEREEEKARLKGTLESLQEQYRELTGDAILPEDWEAELGRLNKQYDALQKKIEDNVSELQEEHPELFD